MNDDLRKSMENVAFCSEAIDELSKSLNHYTEAYAKIRDTLTEFHNLEQQASTDIYETVPQMQEHVADFDRSQKELSGILAQSAPIFEKTAGLLKDVQEQMQRNAALLQHHQESLQQLSDTLKNVDSSLSETPELARASSRIQEALGAISDPPRLDQISEKLDTQITQIQKEKEEIIKPLKNAAAFGKVVRQERETLEQNLTDVFFTINSDEHASMNRKLDDLVSITSAMQEKLREMSAPQGKSGGLFSRWGKDDHHQPTKEEQPTPQLTTLMDAVKMSVCIVRKKTWTGDFCFAVNSIKQKNACGHTYLDGEIYGEASYSLDDPIWSIYTGESADKIRQAEMNART